MLYNGGVIGNHAQLKRPIDMFFDHDSVIPSEIVNTTTASDVASYIFNNVPADNSIVFVDIDDTLIAPVSNTLRIKEHRQAIDDIKNYRDQYPNYDEIFGNLRLQRKVELVDPEWQIVIENLKEKYHVFGLTKLDTGKVGPIPSMEQWRYEQVKSFGVEFSQVIPSQKPEVSFTYNANLTYKPSFHNGIFYTGDVTKGKVLEYTADSFFASNTAHIVLIDDSLGNLEDLQNFCKDRNIGFSGLLFNGMIEKTKNEVVDLKLVEFQTNYLKQSAEWLEDDLAKDAMTAIAQKSRDASELLKKI